MSSQGHIRESQPESEEDIESYLEQIELYFATNAVPEDRRVLPLFDIDRLEDLLK